MLKKHYYKGGNTCRVWFYLPSEVSAKTANLVGDFNDWDEGANPMKKKKDGTFYTAVTLETGNSYQFRYLLDNSHWENDWNADDYAPNEKGTENSVVSV
jgi:1,4-alpha-glucan branching enzyme